MSYINLTKGKMIHQQYKIKKNVDLENLVVQCNGQSPPKHPPVGAAIEAAKVVQRIKALTKAAPNLVPTFQ